MIEPLTVAVARPSVTASTSPRERNSGRRGGTGSPRPAAGRRASICVVTTSIHRLRQRSANPASSRRHRNRPAGASQYCSSRNARWTCSTLASYSAAMSNERGIARQVTVTARGRSGTRGRRGGRRRAAGAADHAADRAAARRLITCTTTEQIVAVLRAGRARAGTSSCSPADPTS